MSRSRSPIHRSRSSRSSTDLPEKLFPDCYFFHEKAGTPHSPTDCAHCYAYLICLSEYEKEQESKQR